MADAEAHRPRLCSLDHIGIHVRDIDKVIESWERMFGIGPWVVREMTSTTPEGKTLTKRLAFARTDNGVEIELIQPQEGSSQFLDAHGEGLHHWGIFVDDVDEEAVKVVEHGAKVSFKGPGGNIHLEPNTPDGVRFELIRRR